jgi:hypothetical protein
VPVTNIGAKVLEVIAPSAHSLKNPDTFSNYSRRMKSLLVLVSLLGWSVASPAATLKWSGARNPCKISAGDGVTQMGTKIGKFLTLTNNAEWAQVIFNVNNRFQGSTPWVTLAVGTMPETTLLAPEEHEKFLAHMTGLGVDVFLEVMPRKTNDVPAALDQWLSKFKHHACVKGIGVDLEFYKRVDDATAKAWDERIKSHNAKYRMFLKHWEEAFMPPTYRSDIIFINTSSEASVEALNMEFAQWAAHFAPSAVAFQFGYPADEDGMDGKNTTGWWKLNDPIKDWGHALLAQIKSPEQEIGFLWVCVKSGKTYNAKWDLTKGATVPAARKVLKP